MFIHIQMHFSSSKLIVMELVMVVVIMHCLKKVITNLDIVIWEEERGC